MDVENTDCQWNRMTAWLCGGGRGATALPCGHRIGMILPARRYRLMFRNVLRVHQGEEYARWVARREGETCRDVRRRLIKAGYDGVRVEYHDGSAVEYVAFSNRNITPMVASHAKSISGA